MKVLFILLFMIIFVVISLANKLFSIVFIILANFGCFPVFGHISLFSYGKIQNLQGLKNKVDRSGEVKLNIYQDNEQADELNRRAFIILSCCVNNFS